jgi:O-acetyl-ADP-ribose deacetylase (regulator of RNase III)
MSAAHSIRTIVGDITEAPTEAIVNAANNELWMGSGVAGAIKSAGGEEIEREAISKGPIFVGQAIATGAGRLPYKAVIHAAAMGWENGEPVAASVETVRAATESALDVCNELGLTSIAFPALGAGVGGFDLSKCAETMTELVTTYLSHPDNHITQVVFVLRNENARQTFNEALQLGGFVP